jgi:DNA polymerase-1
VASDREHVAYLQCGGFVTEGYLTEKAQHLCDSLETLVTPDLKALLGHLTVNEEKHCVDTTIAAYLLNPLKSEYEYDDLAKDYLDLMLPSKVDLFGKKKLPKVAEEEPKAAAMLACYVAYTSIAASEVLLEKLKESGMDHLYTDIEMPLVFTLFDMEQEGIRTDGAALKVYGEQLVGKIAELETSIYEKAGEEFNINSPKQLGVILFEKLQMPNGKKTKTGYSTAADVLDKLAPDYPIVSEILEYRQLTKLKSTYADGLAAYIGADGRIHSTFNQTITATGRISSTEPNLQNIPIRMELGRLIRKVFIPKEDYVFIDADYSQIELRVLAHMSGDENLIDAYRHAQDIHRMTASQVFHTPFEEVTDLQRRNAKAVNFGIVYGISSFGLSQDLSITRKEAEGYIASYFETYPGIKTFLDRLVSEAKETGYAKTMFGRKRPVPELSSSNFMQRSFGERIAMNSPIQGTAADIIKIAMIRVRNRLKAEGLKSRLILQVHDELLIETASDEIDQVKVILDEEMRHAADMSVELEVDMNVGDNWYEAH